MNIAVYIGTMICEESLVDDTLTSVAEALEKAKSQTRATVVIEHGDKDKFVWTGTTLVDLTK